MSKKLNERSFEMKRGEIYLVDFGKENVGVEQSGVRPAVIVQNNIGNKYSPATLICPLTSQNKTPLPTHVQLSTADGVAVPSTVLCEQSRVIDKQRIVKKLGEIFNPSAINDIDTKIKVAFGL